MDGLGCIRNPVQEPTRLNPEELAEGVERFGVEPDTYASHGYDGMNMLIWGLQNGEDQGHREYTNADPGQPRKTQQDAKQYQYRTKHRAKIHSWHDGAAHAVAIVGRASRDPFRGRAPPPLLLFLPAAVAVTKRFVQSESAEGSPSPGG